MADKRNNNGGHSTKAKGIDKRKNPYRALVSEVVSEDDFREVLTNLMVIAKTEDDISAIKLFFEYTAGKPTENMNVSHLFEEGVKLPEWMNESKS